MKTKIINIILVIISMLAIFLFSSEKADDSNITSRKITSKFVRVIDKDKDKQKLKATVEEKDSITRKAAHFLEYALLGFLVLNMLKDYKKINIKLIIISILICILYAISDEIHQYFVPGRSCQFTDVLIDSTGSVLGTILYFYIFSNFKKSVKKK